MSYSWNNVEIIMNYRLENKEIEGIEERIEQKFLDCCNLEFYNNETTRIQYAGTSEPFDLNEFLEVFEDYLKEKSLALDYGIQSTWWDTREPSETYYTVIENGEMKSSISSHHIWKMLNQSEVGRLGIDTPVQLQI